jgi:hypothetical protein
VERVAISSFDQVCVVLLMSVYQRLVIRYLPQRPSFYLVCSTDRKSSRIALLQSSELGAHVRSERLPCVRRKGQDKDIASSVNMLANEAVKFYCETNETMLCVEDQLVHFRSKASLSMKGPAMSFRGSANNLRAKKS